MLIIAYLWSGEIITFPRIMNFPPADPKRFLLESIPNRFQQLSPDDFGVFVRYLFQLDGYEVKPLVMSSDFGYHLEARKDSAFLVILPVLAAPDTNTGSEEVIKAIRAKALYKADQAWIISTTSFSPEAVDAAEDGDIELWDWDALYDAICQLFFEGKTHLDYVMPPPPGEDDLAAGSLLKLKVKWVAQEGIDASWYNLQLHIVNPTDTNIYVHLELPAFIDSHKNQVFAEKWVTDEFVSGLIYAGATVRTNALFKTSRLGDRPPGGYVMLTYHERRDTPLTFHLHARLKGEACYLVTYYFSRESEEYRSMTAFRDQVLRGHWMGRLLIRWYYALSPSLVTIADHHPSLHRICYRLIRPIITFVHAKAKQPS